MTSAQSTSAHSRAPLIVLCAILFVLVWPAIIFGHDATSESDDQTRYHLPVIEKMSQQWPHVDLVNYKSATTPGYHLMLAMVHRYVTDDLTIKRLISSLFGLGLILIVFHHARRFTDGWTALACTLPLVMSSYVLSGSIWLTTDNAAWMFAALALGAGAMSSITPVRLVGGSIRSTFAVFVRQIHIWTIAPLGIAGLLHLRERNEKRHKIIVSLATLLAPVILLAIFIKLWHGLVPPADPDVQRLHAQGMNPAAVPLTLALFGLLGVFFVPLLWPIDWKSLCRDRLIWIAAAFGLVASLAVPTSFSYEAGRWGGLIWVVIHKLPAPFDRNIVFPPLAILGAVILALGWRRAAQAGQARFASLLLFGVMCWLAAQSMNSQAWQRYFEPMILITLAWLISLASSRSAARNATTIINRIGPVILSALLLLLSFATLYRPLITGETPTSAPTSAPATTTTASTSQLHSAFITGESST